MQIRRSALALVAAAALGGLTACGSSVETAQCDLAATALNAGQLATAAELYARAQQSGEGTCADTGLDAVGNRYASAFRESARGTALEVVADDSGARAAYQSALALDQNNQPAMNGLARLGTPQEQRVDSLALPAVAPYPQASWWTGWPIVLPTFLLAVAALVVGGLLWRRAPSAAGPRSAQRRTPDRRASSWPRRRRTARRAAPAADADSDESDPDYSEVPPGRGEPDAARPAPSEPTPAQPTPAQPTPAQPTPAQPTPAQPTPSPAAPARPPRAGAGRRAGLTTHPVTDHEARTDPITAVTPGPRRGLDLGRVGEPSGGGTERGDGEDDPEPARPAVVPERAEPEAAEPHRPEPHRTEPHRTEPHGTEQHRTEPHGTEQQRTEPLRPEQHGPEQHGPDAADSALTTQAGEIGQLQRLLDRSVRADDRPLPQRFYASGVSVPGPAIGVTLAVCDVGLTGGDQDSRRLLCVQRLVIDAIPDGDWVPATGVDWLDAVRTDIAQRPVGGIRDHDNRIWSTDPVPDERALLRLVDRARTAWTALLRGEEPSDEGFWNPPSSARSSALQAAFEGREAVVSPGPRPAGVRVVALVDALLADAPDGPTIVNARVEAQHREMLAVAAAESIEFGLAAELVDLQNRGSNP